VSIVSGMNARVAKEASTVLWACGSALQIAAAAGWFVGREMLRSWGVAADASNPWTAALGTAMLAFVSLGTTCLLAAGIFRCSAWHRERVGRRIAPASGASPRENDRTH